MRSRVKHFQNRKRPKGKRNFQKLAPKQKGLVVAVGIALVLFCSHIAFRPVIETISGNQARILATSLINTTVLDELAQLDVQYESFVSFIYDGAGNIAAIETNAIALNQLKARLAETVNQALADMPRQTVKIPIGTLTGIEFLSGRGPNVNLKMVPSSYIDCQFVNNFDAAGINQTRHQILIRFHISMSAILTPYTTTTDVETTVVVAETVIVGAVPDMFANIVG